MCKDSSNVIVACTHAISAFQEQYTIATHKRQHQLLQHTLSLCSDALSIVCNSALSPLSIAGCAVIGLTACLGTLVVGVLSSCASPVGCLLAAPSIAPQLHATVYCSFFDALLLKNAYFAEGNHSQKNPCTVILQTHIDAKQHTCEQCLQALSTGVTTGVLDSTLQKLTQHNRTDAKQHAHEQCSQACNTTHRCTTQYSAKAYTTRALTQLLKSMPLAAKSLTWFGRYSLMV